MLSIRHMGLDVDSKDKDAESVEAFMEKLQTPQLQLLFNYLPGVFPDRFLPYLWNVEGLQGLLI